MDSPSETARLRTRIRELQEQLANERRAAADLRRSQSAQTKSDTEADSIYRRLVELSPDAILIHDHRGRVVFINGPGVLQFGATSDSEIIGHDILSFVHPEDRDVVASRATDLTQKRGLSGWGEHRRVRLDGTIYHAESAAEPITWLGNPAVLVVIRDITERKTTHLDVLESLGRSESAEQVLLDAIEATSEAFALYGADERLILCNRHYVEKIWPMLTDIIHPGCRFEDLVRTAIERGVWEGSGKSAETLLDEALRRHRDVPSISELLYPDGRLIRCSKQPTANGGIVAIYSDLTETRKREQDIREREERHRRLLETLPDAVMIHSDGKIAYVNPAAINLFAAETHTDLVGRRTMEMVHPDDRQLMSERYNRVLNERCALSSVEQRRIRLDGSEVHVETRGTFIIWNGKPAFLGVLRDLTERREAEAALQETEQRLSTVATNMPGAIFQRVMHPDGSLTYPYVSQGIIETHGVSAESVMADPTMFRRLLHPDDEERFQQALGRSAKDLTPVDTEVRNIRPDGTIAWIRSTARCHRRHDGAVVWDGILTEVTEKKEAEELAKTSHRRLLEAINAMSEGFVLWDREDRLVLWNERFVSFAGLDADILKEGLPFEAFALVLAKADIGPQNTGDDRARALELVRLHRKASGSFETMFPNDQWMTVTERRTPEDHTVGIYTDISQMKRAAQALRESEETSRALVDAATDYAILIDRDLKILAINNPLAKAWNRNPADVIGKSMVDVAPAEVQEVTHRRWQEALESGKPVQTEAERRGRWFHSNYFPVLDNDGRSTRLAIFSREITEQKLSQQKLREAKEAAEFANRTKSEFLANMSHELRTPLNAVIGFSEILREEMLGPLGNPSYVDYVRDIHDSGIHLLQVINDILDISKIEAGKLVPTFRETDPRQAIETSIRIVRGRADLGTTDISIRVADNLPMIIADERMLKQIVINLMTNSVKFTPPGGKVRVMARPSRDGGLQIVVTDNGIGIAKEDLPVVMAPFGQVESQLNRRYEGTGLGLPLVQSLVEIHGGKLRLRSKPGLGTSITIWFPAPQDPAIMAIAQQADLA